MKIGETYWRTSPIGDKGMITIDTQEELEYHKDLQKQGFAYILQPVSSPSVCLSCES